MLANVLPGLRELRPPLSAGYLWLAFIWLVAAPRFPDISEADGMERRILELFRDLDVVGSGVVLSFIAYLVGAVSQATLDPVLRLLASTALHAARGESHSVSPKAFYSVTQLVEDCVNAVTAELHQNGLSLKEVAERERRKDTLARAGLTDEELDRASHFRGQLDNAGLSRNDVFLLRRAIAGLGASFNPSKGAATLETFRMMKERDISVEDLANQTQEPSAATVGSQAQRAEQAVMQSVRDLESMTATARAVRQALQGGLTPEELGKAADVNRLLVERDMTLDDVEFVEETERRMEDAARRAAHWDTASLIQRVLEDLDLVATRLIGKEPDLYSAVDRLRSEAEFRLAIVVPLAALVMLLLQLHLVWIYALPVSLILFVDGIRRDRAARNLVIDALFLGRVAAPALERFEQSAKDVIESPTSAAPTPVPSSPFPPDESA